VQLFREAEGSCQTRTAEESRQERKALTSAIKSALVVCVLTTARAAKACPSHLFRDYLDRCPHQSAELIDLRVDPGEHLTNNIHKK